MYDKISQQKKKSQLAYITKLVWLGTSDLRTKRKL